jgi:hypothetical protein
MSVRESHVHRESFRHSGRIGLAAGLPLVGAGSAVVGALSYVWIREHELFFGYLSAIVIVWFAFAIAVPLQYSGLSGCTFATRGR